MFCFISSLAIFRLKGEYGFAANVRTLSGEELARYKNQNSNNVVIFADKYTNIEFADYAIEKFNKSISIVRAPTSEGNSTDCEGFPCIQCFKNNKKVGPNAPLYLAGLLQWFNDITHPPVIELKHPEDIRILFNKPGSFIIGVDTNARPKSMKDSEILYTVSSRILQYFDINAKQGIYVYRSADRMFVRTSGNFRSYMKTPIVDPQNTNLTSKPYVGGYFLEGYNKEANEKEMEILTKLAFKFKDVNFLPIGGGVSAIFNEIAKIDQLTFPLFLLLPSDNNNDTRRWVIQGENADNFDYVSNVIQGAINGSLKYHNVSEKIDPENKHQATLNTIKDILAENNETCDTIIAYVSNYMDAGAWYKALMPVSADLINNSNVRFYVYDLSLNDPEEGFPQIDAPSVLMYRKGTEDPIHYGGNQNIKDFIDWVCNKAENHPEMPKYSPMHYMNDVLPPVSHNGFNIKYAEEVFGMPGEPSPDAEDDSTADL